MASFTKISETKRRRKHKNGGSARKAKQAQRSTLSYDELFAACGAPRDAKAEAPATEG
ncbi:hypothetical protein [Paraliomyxa miuraensis]|uniref:hypothetical protein n=1 Tax=Paraliomyxa miuraensis TaxID=376150 RepID=UPI0022552614|nr:hypothetical protein [Paraliomyxa miuraensis]MCX4244586.1 hypothetical protein [Paraliomyxa miuraensis]